MARKVSGITIEIDGNTTGLQDALKKVDSQLKTTQQELKNVDRKLKLNPSSFETLKQKQKDLQTAIKQTENRLDMLKKAQENAVRGTEEWDNLQREINDTEAELKGLQNQYKEFGSAAAQEVKRVGEEMQKIGGKMQEVGRDLTTYVTLPIVAAGTKAVKSYADVDKTMQLTNKTMGNSAEQADLLNKAMEQAAANSVFGMSDAATASLNFARAGLTAEEAAAALAPAMNLAAGEGGNLDTVSAGLVATINGFQDSFDNTTHYADVFAAACNNSALDIDSLSGAMSTAAPIFKTAGYSVEDATLYMGVMANNGIEASEAANSLKTGIARLVSPAKEGAIAMEKLGFKVTNADGSMKDSITIQKELHDAFSKLSESEQIAAASAIFGKNQMSKWLTLINTAPADVEELNKSLHDVDGTTQEMADTMMGGFGGSIEKLKSSLDVLMTSLGKLIAEFLQPVIDKVQGWIDKFNALDDGTKKTIIKIAGIVAAVGPLLIIGGKLITGIGMLLAFAPMLGGAFLPIIAIIAGLVIAGVALYKNWDKLKAGMKKLVKDTKKGWETLKKDVSKAVKDLKNNVKKAWNTIKTTVVNTATNIKNTVVKAWETMKTNVTTAVNNLKTSVETAWNNLKTKVTTIVESIKTTVQTAWENLKTKVTTTVTNLKTTVETTWSNLKTAVTTTIENLKSTIVQKWEGMKTDAINKVKEIKTNVETWFNNTKQAAIDIVQNIKNELWKKWDGMVTDVSKKFKEIYDTIKGWLDSAIEKAQEAAQAIKSALTIDTSGGGGIGGSQIRGGGGHYTKYASAYHNPVLFTHPTVLATPYGNKMFGDGNGAEIVMGLNKLRELVGMGDMGGVTINVYAQPGMDVNQLANAIQDRFVALQKQRSLAYA